MTQKASGFSRYYWRGLFRVAKGREYRGVEIKVLLPTWTAGVQLLAKTESAVDLISTYDRRQYDRIRRLVDGILIFGEGGAQAEWHEAPRVIRLNECYVADSKVEPGALAATIVHETTHAWLNALGFQYVANRRQRIEAICHRSAAAFLRRTTNGEVLADRYEDWASAVLGDTESAWSNAAFDERFANDLEEMHVPRWLIRVLVRTRRGRAA